jgi:hypothetical protein
MAKKTKRVFKEIRKADCTNYDSCLEMASYWNKQLFGCDRCQKYQQAETVILTRLDMLAICALLHAVFFESRGEGYSRL